MKDLFRRNLWWSLSLHVAVVLLLLVIGWLGWHRSRRPVPALMVVDLAPPPPVVEPVSAVKEPAAPGPVPAAKIRKSTRKVVRRLPRIRTPTSEELREMLSQGLPEATRRARAPLAQSLPQWYYAAVRQRLYELWQQPPASDVPPGARARAVVRIRRDGSVAEARLVQGSGLDLMDESVKRALQQVGRFDPLPPTYGDREATITVDFVLSSASGVD